MDYFQLILLTLATPFTLIWIYLAIAGGKKYQKYTDSSFAKEFQMSELLCVGFSVMRILHISTKTILMQEYIYPTKEKNMQSIITICFLELRQLTYIPLLYL